MAIRARSVESERALTSLGIGGSGWSFGTSFQRCRVGCGCTVNLGSVRGSGSSIGRNAMKRLFDICLVSLFVALSFGSSYARPSTHGFGAALRAMDGPITVPPEWDGIWTTADSTYDCTAGFTEYSTGKDTICGGRAYSQAPP